MRKRRGFTLIELLVVIAILAILAAVSVVGYTSFIKKARISNDESLCAQINTVMQGNEVLGNTAKTAHEAVLQLYENGVTNDDLLLETDGYHLVYDIENNRFGLLDENDEVVFQDEGKKLSSTKFNIFVFVNSGDMVKHYAPGINNTEYSIYLGHGFAPLENDKFTVLGTANDGGTTYSITTRTGFDVGFNTNIQDVTIDNNSLPNTDELIVRTIGGKVSIDVPYGDVKIYGATDELVVLDAAPNSVHICDAIVARLIVDADNANAHVEIESGATIAYLEADKGNITVAKPESVISYYSASSNVTVSGVDTTVKKENKQTVPTTVCTSHTPKTYKSSENTCTICSVCGDIISISANNSEVAYVKASDASSSSSSGGSGSGSSSGGSGTTGGGTSGGGTSGGGTSGGNTPTSGDYTITYKLTNVSADSYNATSIDADGSENLSFWAYGGYQLPETITVTGIEGEPGWDYATGTLNISNPTGNVVITIVGVSTGGGTGQGGGGNQSEYTTFTDFSKFGLEPTNGGLSGSLDANSPRKYKLADSDAILTYYEPITFTRQKRNIIIDLNGKTIVYKPSKASEKPDANKNSYDYYNTFITILGENVTIQNGTIISEFNGISVEMDTSSSINSKVTLNCNLIANEQMTNSGYNSNVANTYFVDSGYSILNKTLFAVSSSNYGNVTFTGGSYKVNADVNHVLNISDIDEMSGCFALIVGGNDAWYGECCVAKINAGTFSGNMVIACEYYDYYNNKILTSIDVTGGTFNDCTVFVGIESGTKWSNTYNSFTVTGTNNNQKYGNASGPSKYKLTGSAGTYTVIEITN